MIQHNVANHSCVKNNMGNFMHCLGRFLVLYNIVEFLYFEIVLTFFISCSAYRDF